MGCLIVEVLNAAIVGLANGHDAVVTDGIEGDHASTARPYQLVSEALVSVFVLRISKRPDEPVEDLPNRERQVLLVLFEDSLDVREQHPRLGLRAPCRIAPGAPVAVFTAVAVKTSR